MCGAEAFFEVVFSTEGIAKSFVRRLRKARCGPTAAVTIVGPSAKEAYKKGAQRSRSHKFNAPTPTVEMVNLEFGTFSPYDDQIIDRTKIIAKATMGVQR